MNTEPHPVWKTILALAGCAILFAVTAVAQQNDPPVSAEFRVRYVAAGAVYVQGGRTAGLAEGTILVIQRAKPESGPGAQNESPASGGTGVADSVEENVAAKLKVVTVAETSAVCEVLSSSREIVTGDIATLPQQEIAKLVEKRALSNTRQYPAIVSFTEGDPLDEDVREAVPKPPLPEVNRARGRIGFDYSAMNGVNSKSSQLGLVVRTDITRINGTYWNLSGYWRGRISSRSTESQNTIQDLVNRTYHLSLTYANPDSRWVAGLGRMYLPWASSLETIDGGYFGRRVSERGTVGIFAGSTPDPTSWSYDPNRRIGGSFVNVEGGSFDQVKYSSTFGVGVSTMKWRIDRPFVFAENTVSYKQEFSLYHAAQVDRPRTDPSQITVGAGLSRSFLTFRVQPHQRVTFDLNHNYFRDVPTFDPQLVGTGLLDKYLFQGVSGGVRVEMPRRITLYTTLGRSSSSADNKTTWNTMYGVTAGQVWRTGLRIDLRYSKFDSAFARGAYRTLSISRNFGDQFRWEVQAGKQKFVSPLSNDNGSRFASSTLDLSLRAHYFVEAGMTMQRGGLQRYNQFFTTFGYRFDNRNRKKEAVRAADK